MEIIMSNYSSIDLSGFYNHKAFKNINDLSANYINKLNHSIAVNRFLDPALNIIADGNINNNDISFTMPDFFNDNFDNIYCNGQNIPVVQNIYNKICILAFCEYGNQFDYFKLSYTNNTDKIKIGFCDFGSYEKNDSKEFGLVYNCRPEYRTKAIRVNDKSNSVNAHIFSSINKIYTEEKLTSIRLPFNDLIHIISITLI